MFLLLELMVYPVKCYKTGQILCKERADAADPADPFYRLNKLNKIIYIINVHHKNMETCVTAFRKPYPM